MNTSTRPNPLASWARRRELDDQAERAVELAIRDSIDTPAPRHPSTHEAADAQLMRGIPILARGVGGTSPGSRPDRIAS